MAKKVNSTYNELKNTAMKSRCSVDNVKNALRKQFKDRLKQLRNESFSNMRNLSDDFSKLQLFKNTLHIEAYGLTPSEILEILEEVERDLEFEFFKNQSEEYEQDNNEIIEHMLEDVSVCPVCGTILNQNGLNMICEQCSNSFNVC